MSGCWLWLGADDRRMGYGGFYFNGRMEKAHRVAWILFRGPIPQGMVVCHANDTPWDVNPENLFLGTQKENVADATKKGRRAIGPRAGKSKLSRQDVIDIRTRCTMGDSQVRVARDYGVSSPIVNRIFHRKIHAETR